MERLTRRRYTLAYKQEAVRLVASGQKVCGGGEGAGYRLSDSGELLKQRRLAVAGRQERAGERDADGTTVYVRN